MKAIATHTKIKQLTIKHWNGINPLTKPCLHIERTARMFLFRYLPFCIIKT